MPRNRRAPALASLLGGLALALFAGCGDSSEAPGPTAESPGASSPTEPDVALTGKRSTAAERYLAAQRRNNPTLFPSTIAAPAPAEAQLFGHPEGFPKAWLAPDERPFEPEAPRR